MRQFQKVLEDLGSRMASAEATKNAWTTPTSCLEASDQMQHLQRLRDKMTTAGALLVDCNEQQSFFTLNQVLVPSAYLSKLEDLNTRYIRNILTFYEDANSLLTVTFLNSYLLILLLSIYFRMKLLQIAMDERHKVLLHAGGNQALENGDEGRTTSNSGTIGPLPNLGQSVKAPWERATTAANVPYYIE